MLKRATSLVAVGALAAAIGGVTTISSASAGPRGMSATVRLDQIGYLPTDTKHAYLMASGPIRHERWEIIGPHHRMVASGSVGADSRGAWNANYPDVYDIAFSRVRRSGTYRLHVSGAVGATSPSFRIQTAGQLYGHLVTDGVKFVQTQRDGADVIKGALDRAPSHRQDASATVYREPDFVDPEDSDEIAPGSHLVKVPGAPKVDVAGGWFDAGDFLKFTQSAAYADVLLYASARELGRAAPTSLTREASYGRSWLTKMWNMRTKTLYLQVGIGSGNESDTQSPTFLGDHDLWRLPQADDGDTAPLDRFAARNRPLFEAAAPGHLISPNLAGRSAAAFALAAQADAHTNRRRARFEYAEATSLYSLADTKHAPDPLVTTYPVSYYPESTWHDDMELGGAEIALAALTLHHNARPYVAQAATWAKDYIGHDTGDTFNLYDVSALAHADLAVVMRRIRMRHLAVTRHALVRDLARQVKAGVTQARTDPFRAAGDVNDFDVDSHGFGWIATQAWYEQLTGDRSFNAFATEQRDWLFGANAWGASFMVGEGTTFPECMQHQVANLAGSLNGRGPIDVGAVVNGPNDDSNFEGGLGGLQDGMRRCPVDRVDRFAAFDGHGASFVDDVRSWQTDEPALDMTGAAVIASAAQLAVNRARW